MVVVAARRRRRRARRQGVPAAARGQRGRAALLGQPRLFPRLAPHAARPPGAELRPAAACAQRSRASTPTRSSASATQILAGAAARDHRSEQHRQPHLVDAPRFPDHPYGRPTNGTLNSVPTITADDLRAYARRVLARDNLKIAVVGDIDAGDARPDARPHVRRAAGDRHAARRSGRAAARHRPADRGRARRAAGGGAHRRRRHRAQGSGFHPGLSWSTTSSAAARSPRGSTTRCARSAASPMASIPTC